MSESSSKQPVTAKEIYAHRLVIIAVISSFATFLIAAFYPSGMAADAYSSLSFAAAHGWLAAQAFALTIPGLALGLVVGKVVPRCAAWLGAAVMLAVPVIVLCDVIAFSLIAERFLSDATMRIGTTLLPAVMVHVSRTQIIIAVGIIALICVSMIVSWIVAGSMGRRWYSRRDSVKPWVAAVVFSGVALVLSIPALANPRRIASDMGKASARHPFCAFHLVGYHGTGVRVPSGEQAIDARLRGLQAAPSVFQREARLSEIRVMDDQDAAGQRSRPDVIVLVIESFRPEMIAQETMPNLTRFAEKSIWCRNNFSGGNATCYGMFSLFTGLESIWFYRPVRSDPILNRLLHQAGYEIAFYGGHTSWAPFGMAPFITADLFDDFHLEPLDLPESDLRPIERSLRFIDAEGGLSQSPKTPRMAVTFLFGTHLYESYSDPKDRTFHPAEKAEFPHSYSPEVKQRVINSYKNSFRTMDRIIAPLLRDDCVVIVLGDHGESLLDDGTNIHGTRLSRFQNMTPAVISYPGVSPRVIDFPTMHADMLPTLLSILDLPVAPKGVLDGVDLVNASDEQLARRSFATCHVVSLTSMLVGPWTFDSQGPFGHRVLFNIDKWQASYLNPIDQRGLELEAGAGDWDTSPYRQWVIDRFGAESYTTATKQELFASLLRSDDPRIQDAALRIAEDVPQPEPYLYDLIVEASAADDPTVRQRAKKLVIRWHRTPTADR